MNARSCSACNNDAKRAFLVLQAPDPDVGVTAREKPRVLETGLARSSDHTNLNLTLACPTALTPAAAVFQPSFFPPAASSSTGKLAAVTHPIGYQPQQRTLIPALRARCDYTSCVCCLGSNRLRPHLHTAAKTGVLNDRILRTKTKRSAPCLACCDGHGQRHQRTCADRLRQKRQI